MSVSPFGLNMFHVLWQQRLVKDFHNISVITVVLFITMLVDTAKYARSST